ncbi:hypothetical protein QA601_18230 [Chitinispirillales bacterium ANBcel5]|uniref:hypothetical protein n=1 Tax=Cellulosispirillum alkaliphilum TaxID=3039283 RepID=UPI002A55A9A4|nr:hypothetical protein [Chitinispirillales bacterium ANBcel5]
MNRLHVDRTDKYRWNTRHELYTYFDKKYGMKKTDIDSEISSVIKNFKLRQGCPIKTQELWQRVGKTIENKLIGSYPELP